MGAWCSCGFNEPGHTGQVFEGGEVAERSSESRAPSTPVREKPEEFQLDIGRDGVLGYSSIGSVVKTRHRGSNTIRAVKQISKKNVEGNEWREDVNLLKTLDHPHIVKLHETWEDPMSVYLIMEMCRGGNLMNLSAANEGFNESTIAVLVQQMVGAVVHLHEHNIVHSDIRPENWLFGEPVEASTSCREMTLKMIDFGLSSKHGKYSRRSRQETSINGSAKWDTKPKRISEASSSSSKDASQSLFCKSPEQQQLNGGSEPQTGADIWALGVVSYFLLSGQSPFDDAGLSFRNARFVFMPPEIWRPVSSEAKNFIALCLQKDPKARPEASKMLGLPWMRLARSSLAGKHGKTKLSVDDPPLPNSPTILCGFGRIKQLQLLEKAAIIATVHCIPTDSIPKLQARFESVDRNHRGFLPVPDLLRCLSEMGVNTSELMKLATDMPPDRLGAVDYSGFIADIHEFQRNMQDSAIWAVFRNFDGDGTCTVSKKVLLDALSNADNQKSLQETFPKMNIDGIVSDLSGDSDGSINVDQFRDILQRAGQPQVV